MGYRSCLGLLSLGKRFGPERLEAGVHRKCRRLALLIIDDLGMRKLPLTAAELWKP